MNNQNTLKTLGIFTAHDKSGKPVTLEWIKTTLVAPEFAHVMKTMWDIARPAYTPVEMQFLKAFPNVISSDPYFKSFEPLFKNGKENVDWKQAERTMQELLKSHFIFDISDWPAEVIKKFTQDTCYTVTIKDQKTNTYLGFITFLIRATYPQNTIKLMSIAVDPAHQNRGLGKILMSSIFKIMPTVDRIFLCTRVTNNTALRAYRSWGLVHDKTPILDHAFNLEHWTFMEYKATQKDILQKIALYCS